MQKINTNISNILKYLNKRQDMLFLQQNAECSFLHKVCLAETAYRGKNTGRLERKHLSIQRPAEIFQQGTIPGKIFPGALFQGGAG